MRFRSLVAMAATFVLSLPALASWPAYDINQDGIVDFADLTAALQTNNFTLLNQVLGHWGNSIYDDVSGNPNNPGARTDAIARWNVVPWQTIVEPMNLGVVAFHINGIRGVSFSINGGNWIDVSEMRENPHSGVHEYWITIDPADYTDGELEIRAVAFPHNGAPRVLAGPMTRSSLNVGEHSLVLFANDGGTLPSVDRFVSNAGSDETGNGSRQNPYRTIWRAIQSAGNPIHSLTVHLEPGEYAYGGSVLPVPDAGEAWTTIRPAPGVQRHQVKIVRGEGRFRLDRIHLQDVLLDQQDGWFITSFNGADWNLWLDGVMGVGKGPRELGDNGFLTSPVFGSGFAAIFQTDCHYSRYNSNSNGILMRNVHTSDIGSDAFWNPRLVVNCTVTGIDRGTQPFHPDVFQFYGPTTVQENIILYNIEVREAKAQGVFANAVLGIKDIAFVNVFIEKVGNDVYSSQWFNAPTDHLLLWHFVLLNQSWNWRAAQIDNVSVRGSVFQKIIQQTHPSHPGAFVESSWFLDNHIIDVTSFGSLLLGTGTTVGDPGWLNPGQGDYRPRHDSVLRHRFSLMVPADVTHQSRPAMATVGAFEH